jgi:hypothetical protein
MKKLILILSLVFGATLFANAQNRNSADTDKLEGTWKMISRNHVKQPAEYTRIALITPTHFVWTLCDDKGRIFDGAGGTWTLEGNTYTETIEMALPSMENYRGLQFVETIDIQGDQMTKTFKVGGNDYVEVWEKVKH